MSLVAYVGPDEVFVFESTNEDKFIKEYFTKDTGRDIKDYTRVDDHKLLMVNTGIRTNPMDYVEAGQRPWVEDWETQA